MTLFSGEKIKALLNDKEAFIEVVKNYYGHLLTFISFLLLMYLALIFFRYDYSVVNTEYVPEVQDLSIKKDLLDRVIQDIGKKSSAPQSIPQTIRDPFTE